MTERDYAIRSFKEITLNASRHTEERMDVYYKKIKELMNDYQDLILENQMVLEELEQECQEKINENMAYALQYMNAYDYRMNIGHLKKEMNNLMLIYIPVQVSTVLRILDTTGMDLDIAYSSKFLVTCETHHSSYKRTVQNFVSNEILNTNFALCEIEIL